MRTVAPVKNVKRYRDRHGKLRCYHRPTGTAIEAEFGTAAFFAELGRLNRSIIKRETVTAGSLGAVYREYRTTTGFTDLAVATRRGYDKYFALIPTWHEVAMREIEPPAIAAMRDKLVTKHGRRTANYVLSVLSVLYGYGVEKGYATTNPVKDVRRVRKDKAAPRANRPWSDQECLTVVREAPAQIRVPIALCMFTGMRKRDALTVGPDVLDQEGLISFDTSKTGERVTIPLHPALGYVLATRPFKEARTLATTSRGDRWTDTGFDSVWSRFRDDLERQGLVEPDLTIHGLRHTVGNTLGMLGCDIETIRRVLGQRTYAMAKHYSDRAKNARVSDGLAAWTGPFRLDDLRKSEVISMDG